MVIKKGDDWGSATSWDLVEAEPATDREMAIQAAHAHEHGHRAVFSVPDGASDVAKTLGLSRAQRRSEPLCYPFDLGFVQLDDGAQHPFVVGCVARRRFWHGPFLVAMNVGWLGPRYLGPRAHPNDGLLDITTGRLGWRQRLQADRRSRTGTHLPHPELKIVRQAEAMYQLDRRVRVVVDGEPVGMSAQFCFRVVPDALLVIG